MLRGLAVERCSCEAAWRTRRSGVRRSAPMTTRAHLAPLGPQPAHHRVVGHRRRNRWRRCSGRRDAAWSPRSSAACPGDMRRIASRHRRSSRCRPCRPRRRRSAPRSARRPASADAPGTCPARPAGARPRGRRRRGTGRSPWRCAGGPSSRTPPASGRLRWPLRMSSSVRRDDMLQRALFGEPPLHAPELAIVMGAQRCLPGRPRRRVRFSRHARAAATSVSIGRPRASAIGGQHRGDRPVEPHFRQHQHLRQLQMRPATACRRNRRRRLAGSSRSSSGVPSGPNGLDQVRMIDDAERHAGPFDGERHQQAQPRLVLVAVADDGEPHLAVLEARHGPAPGSAG